MVAARGGAFASLAAPGYPSLWASSWFYASTRWMGLFLGSYLINERTGSEFLVQAAGAAFFAPMFLGGPLAGAIADRFDRRSVLLWQLIALLPMALLVGIVEMGGSVPIAGIYGLLVAMGTGGVLDWTCRRAFVYDVVGEELANNALALEMVSLSSGNMLGSMFGGSLIEFLGTGQAFAGIAVMYGITFVLLLPVSAQPLAAGSGRGSFVDDMREGLAVLGRDRPLVSILIVTLVMNLFYFSFLPLAPVFGERLEVNALLTGILAGGQGAGMVAGSFFLAARPPGRRGLAYVVGSFFAMAFLVPFALVSSYPIALAAVLAAGISASAFGTMQGLLVMVTASPEMRGRAMGLLGMAIGALPFGMLTLGGAAQWLGAPTALTLSVATGALLMVLCLLRWPEVLKVD
ncbi:MAG: MFS transporter [Dehalococcoidia bacterium]